MKVAVTGATGLVGTNLCRMLIEKGFSVRVLIHRDDKGLEGLPLERIRGDILNTKDLTELTDGCEVVFNLAASISIHRKDSRCYKLNVESCKKLLEASKVTGIRKIIHFSSIHAFQQEPLDAPLNETRSLALKSQTSYDASKAQGQQWMLQASKGKMEVVVLNPTAILGPCDFKPSLLGNALIRFFKDQIPGLIPGGYDWVDVRDVCSAAINSIGKGVGGECYLLPGHWQSLEVLAKEIHKLGGHQPPKLYLPEWLAQLGTPFLNLHARLIRKPPLYTSVSLQTLKYSHQDIPGEKARTNLDFHPRPFTDTIADTLRWFRENHYI